jgi:hypothetical protein
MTATPSLHRCWDQETIDLYFTTEAMAKTKDAFLEVHLPIEQIWVDRQYNAFQQLGQKEVVDEDALRNLILSSTPQQGNRVFSVIGETGSGKSELCQWLFYSIEDANSTHVPILIRRSMTKLRDIVAIIYEQLGEAVPAQIQDITDLWEESVSKQLVASMLLHLQKPAVLNEIGSSNSYKLRGLIDSRDFELTMRQNFVHYRDEIQRLDKARELNLIPEKQFAQLVTGAGGLPVGIPAIAYSHLQRAITDCLSDTLRVENLIDKLRRISDGFRRQKKRPVLLIEDITTFSFLQNDLLDYLFDLGSGNFDVLIGITTDFERTNEQQIYKAQQTIRERTEGRFVLTDDNNETLFLKENYVRLAQLYLRAIKDEDCSVCNAEPVNMNFGEGIYPFNEQFLQNIYNNLRQDGNRKQTPRLYLRALGQTLRNQVMPPFEYIENLANIESPTAWYSSLGSDFSQLEKLLKWYGMNTNQGVFIPNFVVKAFGLEPPPRVDTVNGYYRFHLRTAGDKSLSPPPAHIISQKIQPMVTRISPREGVVNTPITLTISGANFEPSCTALLNDKKLAIERISEKRLQIVIPKTLPLGTYSVTIINPDQSQTTFPNAYTVKEPSSPSISQIQPNEGEENLPNTVYVNGKNFHRNCTVNFGNNKMKVRWIESTRLEVTVPTTLSYGSYELIVKNPDGKQSKIAGAYTVRPEDLFGQMDQWIDSHGQFPGRAKFKDGLWQLIDMFELKPFELKSRYSIADSGSAITFSRGDRISQVYLHNSADSLQAGYFKLTIRPQKELRDLYSQVLALGQGHYSINDINDLNHPLLYEWLDQRVLDLQQEMLDRLTQALNMPLEQFILAAKFLVLNNCSGVTSFSAETLASPINGEPLTLGSMGNRPKQLYEGRDDIQMLFVGNFHFRDSVINYPLLDHTVSLMDPVKILENLRNIHSEKIYDAFYFGTGKNKFSLRNLAHLVSLYARDLVAIQERKTFVTTPSTSDLWTFFDLMQPMDQISAAKLKEQLDQLRQLCLRTEINWSSAWDSTFNLLHKNSNDLDFPDFGVRLHKLLTRATELGKNIDVFSYLSLQREVGLLLARSEYEILHTANRVYSVIDNKLNTDTNSGKATLNPKFTDFSKAFQTYSERLK